jgi:hypothetical protein
MKKEISDYVYEIWLGNTSTVAVLNGEQGYLCLKRFIKEVDEGKIWIP